MKSYAQNGEDLIIYNYFKGKKGTLLDIGANDGKTLSNSYSLIRQGWDGVLVEPSFNSYKKIFEHHSDRSLEIFNYALSDKEGEFTFWESGAHLNQDDHSLLSTLDENELMRWKGTKNEFEKRTCKAITFNTLLRWSSYKKFDFITLDAEGFDLIILKQIDLNEVGCQVLCIEYNNKEEFEKEIKEYCAKFGMNVIHKNYENLILAK